LGIQVGKKLTDGLDFEYFSGHQGISIRHEIARVKAIKQKDFGGMGGADRIFRRFFPR
jgi:hypothetical protein